MVSAESFSTRDRGLFLDDDGGNSSSSLLETTLNAVLGPLEPLKEASPLEVFLGVTGGPWNIDATEVGLVTLDLTDLFKKLW